MVLLEAPGVEADGDIVSYDIGAGEIEVDQPRQTLAEKEDVVGEQVGVDDPLRQPGRPIFLQEGEIKRVGATKTEKVNVRVVCATNVSLLDKVRSGDFRLDLYYRLNVIRIEVPPLKKRQGDIPLLAIHFLDKYTKRIGKEVPGITDESMKILEQYDWPGNVRQLENEIERAVTLAEPASFIKPGDFSDEVRRFMENIRTINMLSGKKSLKDAIEELERKMIQDCMEACGWNQTQAAKELGLSRQGLIKKLSRYNLNREEV